MKIKKTSMLPAIRVSGEMRKHVDDAAEKKDVPVASILREALKLYFGPAKKC